MTFDVDALQLTYRTTSGGLFTCDLGACAPVAVPTTYVADPYFALAGGRMYFNCAGQNAGEKQVCSTLPTGTSLRRETANFFMGSMTGYGLVLSPASAWSLFRPQPTVGGGRAEFRRYTFGARSVRVPAPRDVGHGNAGGAYIGYTPASPSAGASIDGNVLLPLPATPPTALLTTPYAGAPIKAAFLVRGGRLETCATDANCNAWTDLGPLPANAVTNVDGTHLYVGSAAGLGRCALTEIRANRTCTLAPVSPTAVDGPLLLTDTRLYFRSGSSIVRLTK